MLTYCPRWLSSNIRFDRIEYNRNRISVFPPRGNFWNVAALTPFKDIFPFPRWPTSVCPSSCPCWNTPCPTCMRSLSSTRRSWPVDILTPASRLCLWTRPTSRCLPTRRWASSGGYSLLSRPNSVLYVALLSVNNTFYIWTMFHDAFGYHIVLWKLLAVLKFYIFHELSLKIGRLVGPIKFWFIMSIFTRLRPAPQVLLLFPSVTKNSSPHPFISHFHFS